MYWTVSVEGGPRRVNHAAVALGDQIYSFGGYCSGELYDGSQPVDMHALDTASYRWRRLPVPSDSVVENPSASQSGVPYQRYGHTVVEYEGKAYLWGGRNDEFGACSKMHCFDPETMSWSVIPCDGEAPPARDGHSAVVVGDMMFVFGGFEEDSQRFSQETYAYNFKKRKWYEVKTTGELPQWRDFHTACVIHGKMYVFGGRSDFYGEYHSSQDYYSDKLKVLNLYTGHWEDPVVRGDRPCGRRSHSAWVYHNKMYIFGGYLGVENRHLDELHEFDPKTLCWRRVTPIGKGPSARRRQCTVVVGDRVFLFGGTKPSNSPKLDPVHSGLCDLSDLHVLDYAPSLKDLSSMVVLRNGLNESHSHIIPTDLKQDLYMMTQPNKISLTRHDG